MLQFFAAHLLATNNGLVADLDVSRYIVQLLEDPPRGIRRGRELGGGKALHDRSFDAKR
jgi:hypothetical protein